MAKQICFVFFLLAFFPSPSHGLSLLTETLKCREYCEKTYPLHTYPTVKHFQACQHGCYSAAKQKSLSSFARSFGVRFVHNCSQECKDKFAVGSYYACKLGCAKGKNINLETKTPTVARKSTPPENGQHSTIGAMILHPVLFLHTYGRGMINRLTYYIQSSTSFYFRSDNGGMVVVNIQSPPQLYVSSSNYNDQYPAQLNDEQDETKEQKKDQTDGYSEQHESWIIVRRGHHWLHCVSHKSGVPLWILSSILFLSSFFLLWLCCAATVTSPSAKKSHPEKKAFLIKEFLSASEKKDGQDVPLLSLDENERQADPLPRKDKSAAVISI
ncbi:transmembrane protein 59-like isoform X2 [Dendronephthya gigantea]|uniref:transmembrane protein 59-like isoform X2 n=1 Tax=Dendronephthya gigantea TaxID=151771 RepID=UPI0010691DA1|nr:transmembrane protein 59-like isoform X2 [Dendronephthya gigantea]